MTDDVPDFQSFFRPLLEQLANGKTWSTQDLYGSLADRLELSSTARRERIPSGKQLTYVNRIGWSKTYLKKAGLVAQPARGQVNITDRGRKVLAATEGRLDIKFLTEYSDEFAKFHSVDTEETQADTTGNKTKTVSPEKTEDTPDIRLDKLHRSIENALATELLSWVKANTFQFFEQLVVDLLIAMGYGGAKAENGLVTAATQDGGIDGIISQDRLGLDRIYIQAKRWDKTSIGRPEIQKFVGALAQHDAHKGVFITTSSYAKSAVEYAERVNYRIILIDGEQLTRLMIEHGIGVSIKETYYLKRVDTDYFEGDVV
ncbi:restriction endonuclease [Neolewinella antarctica]|uniref:Restriction system protein n=1 Tax=Neolewinella antarctica TaxID=442734 RepID=A0ABX0X789_9BACT|nr:restriction endonuclease [Neolewinella antarctica]NJC24854.1 restriction system protein [Neolewinella antarctica]